MQFSLGNVVKTTMLRTEMSRPDDVESDLLDFWFS